MMKKTIVEGIVYILLAILVGLLVIQVVKADANISIDIETTGDVNAWTSINTTGNVGVYIDGANWTDIPEYIEENEEDWLRDRTLSFSNIASLFEEVANLIMGKNKHPDSWHVRIANALLSVFVTRPELYEVQKQNEFLLYRVEALENTMESVSSEAFCQGKIDTMLKHNLTRVECQNVTYYNPAYTKMETIVGIEAIE